MNLKRKLIFFIDNDDFCDAYTIKENCAIVATFCKDNEENELGHSSGDKPNQRDKTRNLFNGNVYLKNKLVLAVIKNHLERNPKITGKELIHNFNRSLL